MESLLIRQIQEDFIGRTHYTEEFKREAVRLVAVSGRPIPEIAADPGVGRATLNRWIKEFRDQDLLSGPHEDTSKELARLRKENELLRQERDLLKKAAAFFTRETVRPATPLVQVAERNDEISVYRCTERLLFNC